MTLRFEAVTFDYWRTMVAHYPERDAQRRVAAWLRILHDAGLPAEEPTVEKALAAGLRGFITSYESGIQFSAAQTLDLCIANLGLSVPPECEGRLLDALVDLGPEIELAPGIGEILTELADAGVRLGLISDVFISPSDLCVARLKRLGLHELFGHCSFSDLVGAYKPSPVMFRDALDGLGVLDPAMAVHVGDSRRTDVGGARGCGMGAIRYSGLFDDPDDEPDADHVITDLAEIGALIGLR